MTVLGGNSKAELTALVERIEDLLERKREVVDEIKEVYTEVKTAGFDVKALRQVIRYRAQDRDKLDAHSALVHAYMVALGMLD